MKKNSGSALTSVIIVFLLVTMFGVPLISMVVYNYQLREYDSGIKEAEYVNEMIMDRVATVIKNEVIAAIGEAKGSSTEDIENINNVLLSSYSEAYDKAVEMYGKYEENKNSGKIVNNIELLPKVKENLSSILDEKLNVDEYGVNILDIVNILDLPVDSDDDGLDDITKESISDMNLGNVAPKDEFLQEVCNSIFKKKYQSILLASDGVFPAIYNENYSDIVTNIEYGTLDTKFEEFRENGEIKSSTGRLISRYDPYNEEGIYQHIDIDDYDYDKDYDNMQLTSLGFSPGGEFEIGIESNCKLNDRVPLTTLSATFVIGTPEFNTISQIEQATAPLSTPMLDYSLIVGETLSISGVNYIDGNILARANLTEKNNEDVVNPNGKGIVINNGASLISKKNIDGAVGNGRIATSGDIIMGTNTTLETGTNPIYYRNLYLGEPGGEHGESGDINVRFNGDVLAKDDLEINFSPGAGKEINVIQDSAKNYFGYNDMNNEGPDSSSAIVINSDTSALNNIKITLGNLYLAGRAFIDGVKSTVIVDEATNEPMLYKTGESISVKGNYIAYQTPLSETVDDFDEYPTESGDGIGDYDKAQLEYNEYFMRGKKNGIEDETNLRIHLVDCFRKDFEANNKILDETQKNEKLYAMYKNFDSMNKWKFFYSYATQRLLDIYMPYIKISADKYLEGVAMKRDDNGTRNLLRQNTTGDAAFRNNNANNFEKFTNCFGFYPEETEKRKNSITDWINFDSNGKEVNGTDFFTYISKSGSESSKSISWGGTPDPNADIKITCNSAKGVDGIIIHNGNLTILPGKGESDAVIPFKGLIIVTGNLTIKGGVTIHSNTDKLTEIIVQNYFGTGYKSTGESTGPSELGEGELLDAFVNDGSGSYISAINISDDMNAIDINDLVGITNWKKSSYGRL